MEQTILFSPAVMAAALQFAGTDDIRYYLNGVCLEWTSESTVHVATNGHMLFAHQTPIDTKTYGVVNAGTGAAIIPTADVKRLLRDLKASKCRLDVVPITFELASEGNGGRWSCTMAGCSGELVAGKMLDWRRVVPRSPLSGQVAQFNAEYLARIRKGFELLGSTGGGHYAILHNGNSAAVCLSASYPAAVVVVMPMRYDITEDKREHSWIDAPTVAPALAIAA